MDFDIIYIREHISYKKYNVVKLGRTLYLMNRHNQYKTGEVECGEYIKLYKVYHPIENYVYNLLHLLTFKTPTIQLSKFFF